ncbi:RPA-related protein RADX isoform X2 [Corythoichthys intestinalis]|uniref:RPA-related protein RADX isoform X2 n=1 Tax=Corythoichthys intestinalis TaxID=161448 RepID=UPI0025A53613|nr:RPA-related protein RADX isoform X2 [Corythoichthys intestinalis]
MSASDCVLRRTMSRAASVRNQVVCREMLHVLDVYRYTRDPSYFVYFHNIILIGADFYDVVLCDGDCRISVALDPRLNSLVEKNVLRRGVAVRNAALLPLDLPVTVKSFILNSVEVCAPEGDQGDCDNLPWITRSSTSGPILANRMVYLPLWNNVDFLGSPWRKKLPPQLALETDPLPRVTVEALRQGFLRHQEWVVHPICNLQMIVRITQKSHLMYYGKAERRSSCPYRAVLQVCDHTGGVALVLWESMCVDWYCVLNPGHIISLTLFQVKPLYRSDSSDIEISVNSQHPRTRISVLPDTQTWSDMVPSQTFLERFCGSEQLPDCPHDTVCDVVGLLVFIGRSERIRKGTLLLEYRWLFMEDGRSFKPIRIQLFSTSQPDVHRQLHPMMPVVCCGLKVIRSEEGLWYLTNTPNTLLYCSGVGKMTHAAVQRLRDWVRRQDHERIWRSGLIGGFFTYPPTPASLETYMRGWQGAPPIVQGSELQWEMKKLCYRERKTFCIQATVTMVTHCRRGEEELCIFWRDGFSSSPSSSSWPQSTPQPSPISASLCKRKLFMESPQKGRPTATVQPQARSNTAILFEASLEFLQNTDSDSDDTDDRDDQSSVTRPTVPDFPPVAAETLTMRCDGSIQQAATVTMGGTLPRDAVFCCDDYYTLTLRVLPEHLCVSAVFLPQRTPLSPRGCAHENTWASILANGAFSTHTLPPTPDDLIRMGQQLANKKMLCVLEMCHLGGDTTEVVLSRGFII